MIGLAQSFLPLVRHLSYNQTLDGSHESQTLIAIFQVTPK